MQTQGGAAAGWIRMQLAHSVIGSRVLPVTELMIIVTDLVKRMLHTLTLKITCLFDRTWGNYYCFRRDQDCASLTLLSGSV